MMMLAAIAQAGEVRLASAIAGRLAAKLAAEKGVSIIPASTVEAPNP